MSNFLLAKDREELIKSHRNERDGKVRDRIKAVLLFDKKWTYPQIAEVLLLNEQTVYLHLREYKKEQKLKLASGGSKSKLNDIQTKDFIAHLETKIYQSVAEISDYVQKKYNVIYTLSGLTAWLHEHGFSYKKPKETPLKADPIKQAKFIEKYENLKKNTPEDEPILFLDAVHPTMATKVTRGWIRTGKNKPIATTASRTRLNILGAINLKTMDLEVKKYVTINSESIINFFDLLKKSYPKDLDIHLILDQGPYNTSKITREAAEERNIILHHLPSYSPNLNSIERLWKEMNKRVRNNVFFHSPGQFTEKIMGFFNDTWVDIKDDMRKCINDNFQTLDFITESK